MPSRIVIVEDESLVGLDLQETLERAGYEIVTVIDSADALLAVFQKEKPDLILMDIRLRSYLDGIDAVQRLRLFSDVPVIYITASTTPGVRQRAETTSPDAILSKPVPPETLLETVRKALGESRS